MLLTWPSSCRCAVTGWRLHPTSRWLIVMCFINVCRLPSHRQPCRIHVMKEIDRGSCQLVRLRAEGFIRAHCGWLLCVLLSHSRCLVHPAGGWLLYAQYFTSTTLSIQNMPHHHDACWNGEKVAGWMLRSSLRWLIVVCFLFISCGSVHLADGSTSTRKCTWEDKLLMWEPNRNYDLFK